MIAVLIINYRTLEATLDCLGALLPLLPADGRVHLLDNASAADDVEKLATFTSAHADRLQFHRSTRNLGFAGGMNQLIAIALADPAVDQVLLLNPDTIPCPGFIEAMQAELDPAGQVDMIAARLLHVGRDDVESLGITVYRSTLASNRKRVDEVLLGPTGGCALLTRRLLEDLLASHGEWFDEAFFCYAEDTDLMLRARWLGYRPGYAETAIVRHRGSLSSGGPDNTFVLYHGIRNSIWWLLKGAPTGWLLRSLPWFVTLHVAICLRHLRRGNAPVLWRLYRDAWRGRTAALAKRRRIQATRRVDARQFPEWVQASFYERDYVRAAWRELWSTRKREKRADPH